MLCVLREITQRATRFLEISFVFSQKIGAIFISPFHAALAAVLGGVFEDSYPKSLRRYFLFYKNTDETRVFL